MPTHTSAYVSIRQHTSAYVSIRKLSTGGGSKVSTEAHELVMHLAYVSIRQHTSAYVSTEAHELVMRLESHMLSTVNR